MQVPEEPDFAISYAGEEEDIAHEIDARLCELGFSVFYAGRSRPLLVGQDGEQILGRIFRDAKQVVVLLSRSYTQKPWTRYEWDVILKRSDDNRFIPVRVDDTPIFGLDSTRIYLRFTGNNYQEIVDVCVQKLLAYEKAKGIRRSSEYDRILDAFTDTPGAVATAYQLVKDKRQRTPLVDCIVPNDEPPRYRVAQEEWFNFSVVRRLTVRVVMPRGLSRARVTFNLKHCAASYFNAHKPDAVAVFGYFDEGDGTPIDSVYTAGKVVFAPFGDWAKAQDGVAYNIPTSEFRFRVDLA